MIVLDECLSDNALRDALRRWHRPVHFLTEHPFDVPPGTEDPELLGRLIQVRDRIFVTENTSDFFRRTDGHRRCCILGLAVGTRNPELISTLIRQVLLQAPFSSRHERSGRVIRAARHEAWAYYRRSDPTWARVVYATGEVERVPRPDLQPGT